MNGSSAQANIDLQAGVPLPTDRPRTAGQLYAWDVVQRKLPDILCRELNGVCGVHGCSPFAVLVSAWAIVLARWAAQDAITLHVTARCGLPSEQGNCFSTATRLEIELRDEFTVGEVVTETSTRLEAALAAADGFGELCIATSEAPADLSLVLHDRSEGWDVSIQYACNLFQRESIGRVEACWHTLLRAMVADRSGKVDQLPLLTLREREQSLQGANDIQTPYSRGSLLHELFEAQARLTPGSPAVTCEEVSLTYAELDALATRLAHYLRSRGVRPEKRVAICLERGTDLLVGLLGILKAGGAYVPLDPSYPRDRLAHMLQDSAPVALLTHSRLKPTLPDTTAVVVAMDEPWNEIHTVEQPDETAALEHSAARRLAYVIYTSGSTGRPKGVMVEHQSVVNLLESLRTTVGITARESMLALTTLSFDIAALELYLPLLCGARVVLAKREVASDPQRLAQLIEKADVTVAQATPVTWRMLLESGWKGAQRLRALCGGEALPWELSMQLRRKAAALWNVYGPTETTIWSTVHEVSEADLESRWHPITQPIGRAVANTRLYVLDACRRPVPKGARGELYIGGDGVARGYLNQPDLTAERFVEDPFGGPDARMYRTGDVVRWRNEGVLEFLGRADGQVKIRGHRIEPAEIEAVLLQDPAVRQAVVVAREDGSEHRHLVAYVVADSAAAGGKAGADQDSVRDSMVGGWQSIWKDTYARDAAGQGPTFSGWNSSFTGEPIPEAEMQEWLTCTVQRIAALEPT
jgi:amino acid adenylation domain-containing protein